jgi:hypothetical protein
MTATARKIRLIAPLDWGLCILLVAGAVAALPVLRSEGTPSVVVYRDHKLLARYPLSATATFTVDGAQGPVTVELADGHARVKLSSCPHGICAASGAINTPGRQIVCAPNHVLVQIVSEKRDTPDAVAQ